jgi:hypothetical protein
MHPKLSGVKELEAQHEMIMQLANYQIKYLIEVQNQVCLWICKPQNYKGLQELKLLNLKFQNLFAQKSHKTFVHPHNDKPPWFSKPT